MNCVNQAAIAAASWIDDLVAGLSRGEIGGLGAVR